MQKWKGMTHPPSADVTRAFSADLDRRINPEAMEAERVEELGDKSDISWGDELGGAVKSKPKR